MSTKQGPRPVIFGEVLFDHFPDGSVVLGGAPFNVAWHLQAFGQAPLFISRIGDDELGETVRTAMHDWGMDNSGLQIDKQHVTGTVEIQFKGSEPHYDILDNVAYDFIESQALPAVINASALYHGSLALRHDISNTALQQLRTRSAAPSFIDVNLRDPWWELEKVSADLRQARWVKLNEAELATLIPTETDLLSQAAKLQATTNIEILFITRGAQGALARNQDGKIEEVTPTGKSQVVDSVGAGDSFASVLLLGLLNEWDLATTLQRAQAFASAVVGIRGATTRQTEFYEPFIDVWAIT